MSSVLTPDNTGHWDIPKPGPKPLPGAERAAWLDLRALRRHQRDINQLLDGIAPELRRNVPIELDQNVIACAVLEYIEALTAKTARATTVRLVLVHLQRGFRSYCRAHDLPIIRLPLITELAIDDGLLDGNVFADYQTYRALVDAWSGSAQALLSSTETPSVTQICGLLIMSSALFGGLARQDHWLALVERIRHPLHYLNKTIQFDLGDDFAWQADPITETLLRRLHHLALLPLEMPRRPTLSAAIRPFTDAAGVNTGNPVTQLKAAAKAMLTLHFAPDVASIALGLLPNTSLPRLAGDRIIHSCHAAPQGAFHFAANPSRVVHKFPVVTDPPMAAFLSRVRKAVAWDTAAARAEGLQTIEFSKPELEYREELSRDLKQITTDFHHHCSAEGVNGNSSFQHAILCYVDDLLHLGGIRKETLAPATIDAYASAVLRKLRVLAVADLHQISAEARGEIYTRALHGSGDSRADIEVAIKLFERTLLSRLDLEDGVDWSTVPLSRSFHTNVDANLVDPTTYARLLSALESAAVDSEDYRDLLLALSVVLYRFGLRTGEAHELTLADVHWLPDGSALLHVRRSQLTSNKSERALRDVGPINLPERENLWLRQHWERRAAESESRLDPRKIYLFARPGHGSALLSREALFDPIIHIVRWLTSDDNLKIRHFRHGFASRLFLAGRSPRAELDELQFRPEVWQRAYHADGAWLRSYEMGHLSPSTSILAYVHTAILAHYHFSCQVVAELLSPKILSVLAGLDARSLERELHRSAGRATTSSLPLVVDLFLNTVRRTWPLDGAPDSKAAQPQALPPVQLALRGEYHAPQRTRSAPARFEHVFGVVGDRLVNKLDLTAWEIAGAPADLARRWVATTDALTGIGILGKDYQRRPRLSARLVNHGTLLLRQLEMDSSADVPLVLARAIVGMRGRGAEIRMDRHFGQRLVNWFNCGASDSPTVNLKASSGGWVEIRLADSDATDAKGLRLLLILFSVMLLSVEQVNELIAPYRK